MVAVVEIDMGPRLMTDVVGRAQDQVKIGMKVGVTFQQAADAAGLPAFEPL